MNADEAVALLQRMHGSALHCVVALLIGHALKGLDVVTDGNICAWSGKSQDAVGKGMALLLTIRIGELAFVERLGFNPNRWRLTGAGRQMLLPLAELLTGGRTPFFAESVGGGSSINESISIDSTTTTTRRTPLLAESGGSSPQSYPQAVGPQADASPVVLALVGALLVLGCPRARAVECVELALSRGESARDVAEKIVNGKAYAASARGLGIFHVGAWLAACLEDGRAIPDVPRVRGLEGYDGYVDLGKDGEDERRS